MTDVQVSRSFAELSEEENMLMLDNVESENFKRTTITEVTVLRSIVTVSFHYMLL